MEMENKKTRHIYRLIPCPAYDVEGMESWLSDMAKEGLFLAQDGFFAGVASFERGTPRAAKYRLDASQKGTGMWSENDGEPDPMQVELGEKYGWSYVAKRKDFYIYRCFDKEAREFNTDPDVQALALNDVKKRQSGAVFTALFWFVLYPLVFIKGMVFTTIISIKTWVFLLFALLSLTELINSIAAFVSLKKLQQNLRDGVRAETKDWRKKAAVHHLKNFLDIAFALTVLCVIVHSCSASVMDEDKTPLAGYTKKLPFAAMRDFAGEGYKGYGTFMEGINFNHVKEWSDMLAPQCIEYSENARVTSADGRELYGALYVDYYEAKNDFVAKCLAKEHYRHDRGQKNFRLLKIPDLDTDFAAAYTNDILRTPTLLIKKGNVVVRAQFLQFHDGTYVMPLDEWARIMADSI